MPHHQSGRSKIERTAALSIVLAFMALLLHTTSAAAAGSANVLRILVVGDSYSAGNGAGDYYGRAGCRRSHKNYAEDYAGLIEAAPYRQPASVTDAACSGATTSWFFNKESGRPPEISAVNHSYDVIFLTIGGNDSTSEASCRTVSLPRHGTEPTADRISRRHRV